MLSVVSWDSLMLLKSLLDLTLDWLQKTTPTMKFSAKVMNQVLTIAIIPIKKIAEVIMELECIALMSQQQPQLQQHRQHLQQQLQTHQSVSYLQLSFCLFYCFYQSKSAL
jgi:hypothetical protein